MHINFDFYINGWLLVYLVGYILFLVYFMEVIIECTFCYKSVVINFFEFMLILIISLWYPVIPIFAMIGDPEAKRQITYLDADSFDE